MAKVTVGGIEYEIPELNFAALERSWPYIDKAMRSMDPMEGPSAGVSIVAAGLLEADHFDRTKFGMEEGDGLGEDQTFAKLVLFLKKKLKASEIMGLRIAVDDITKEAGLVPTVGELQAATQSNSQEISPTTLPNSQQPDIAEEIMSSSDIDTVSADITR